MKFFIKSTREDHVPENEEKNWGKNNREGLVSETDRSAMDEELKLCSLWSPEKLSTLWSETENENNQENHSKITQNREGLVSETDLSAMDEELKLCNRWSPAKLSTLWNETKNEKNQDQHSTNYSEQDYASLGRR